MARTIALPDEVIINRIYFVRGKKVMLDRDLAELYNVTTGNLNKAVKRNLKRFPDDFLFQLSEHEFRDLIFQNGTSSWGGTRKPPYAYTEQGADILLIFTALKELLNPSTEPRPRVGFRRADEKD
jgi:hypothetical protein